jgi:hypothetical protein
MLGGVIMNNGIVEIDLHGMNSYQARISIDSQLRRADGSVYYIRLIHGFHSGTNLKNMIQDVYGNGSNKKVLRVKAGSNPGITELVLREL